MEVVIDFLYLSNVLILHLPSSLALFARRLGFWEYNLINHNVMDIYVKFNVCVFEWWFADFPIPMNLYQQNCLTYEPILYPPYLPFPNKTYCNDNQ